MRSTKLLHHSETRRKRQHYFRRRAGRDHEGFGEDYGHRRRIQGSQQEKCFETAGIFAQDWKAAGNSEVAAAAAAGAGSSSSSSSSSMTSNEQQTVVHQVQQNVAIRARSAWRYLDVLHSCVGRPKRRKSPVLMTGQPSCAFPTFLKVLSVVGCPTSRRSHGGFRLGAIFNSFR